jgi:hypothetical protein
MKNKHYVISLFFFTVYIKAILLSIAGYCSQVLYETKYLVPILQKKKTYGSDSKEVLYS